MIIIISITNIALVPGGGVALASAADQRLFLVYCSLFS
jgi:hypothetical protein